MCYTKPIGVFAILVLSFSALACNVMARGVGQGEHEADSGTSYSFGGGYSYSGGVGQGHYGPGGACGAAVPSGINSFAVGQAQHDAGGNYYMPAYESNSLVGTANMIASQPSGRSVAA